MRWLTIHLWVVTCLCSLFLSGCAVKQGAHFSIAPEFDKSKIEAISKSAGLRNQASGKKTLDDAKPDQFRVTGFNKRTVPSRPTQSKTQTVLSETAKSSEPVLQFDEFEEFDAIDLAETKVKRHPESKSESETSVAAQKPVNTELEPVFVPESTPTMRVALNTNSTLQTEEEKTQPAKSPQMVDLGLKPLSQLSINAKPPAGDLPTNTAAAHLDQLPARQVVMGESRDWELITKEWEAPGVAYNPLYFEEPNLERFGYNYGALQPFISAGRFFGRVPMLPYMIGAYPLDECRYPLGYARPGDCPPYQVEKLPFSARGALFESLTATGLIFLIP